MFQISNKSLGISQDNLYVATARTFGFNRTGEEKINELKDRIKGLEAEIDESRIFGKKRRAFETISMYASRMLPGMDTERPDDPLELLIDD